MKRTASQILNGLEMRIARLERTSARPSMSPRRQVEEGLFDYEDHNPQNKFEAFELNEKSILNFVRENLVKERKGTPNETSVRVVAVSIDSYHKGLVNVWVKTVGNNTILAPDEFFHTSSFDATVDSKGNVSKIVPDEEHDLTHAQFSRLERRPVDVSIDFDSLYRAFPNYFFNK